MTDVEKAAILAKLRVLEFVVFDFDGVFTDNRVWVSEGGKELVTCCRSDSLGLKRLSQLGINMMTLSTESNAVVAKRAEKLQIPCVHGVEDKGSVLIKEVRSRGRRWEATAFVGNDINDVECLKMVGLGVVVADAWPEVRHCADLVLSRRGGYGAVREFCDYVWDARA